MEGKISNLENVTLYVVYEYLEAIQVDTVLCDDKGKFALLHELKAEDLLMVTFYYYDRNQYFTVYPETGKAVMITGNGHYPQLLQIKGGRTNNMLSEFKKKAGFILKDMADIQRNNLESRTLGGDGQLQLTNLRNELRLVLQDFITKNRKEEASAILIFQYFSNPDETEQTEDLLKLLSPELDDFFLVKDLKAEIEKAKNTQVGAKAPNFKVTNIYGQTLTVDSFTNKYLILAFTSLWCDLCQTEVMMLDEIATKYDTDSLEILLISLDDELDEIREVLRQDSIQWNLVADSAGQSIKLFDLYNVNTLPKCFLMDKDGTIMLNTMNREELIQKVDEIMINDE